MRCSGWSSLAISACSGLALAAPAFAHVDATPNFVPSGSSRSISFFGPNERESPMTGFSIAAPPGLEIERGSLAEENPSQNLALAGVIAFIGVLLVVAIAMLAWRRRAAA